MPDGSLKGKVAWVTGGSSGIGRAVVDTLASRGASVGILDMKAPDDRVAWARCDVSISESVAKATHVLSNQLGHADVLVSNAGISLSQTIEGHSDEEWSRVLGVNLNGAFHLIRACLPAMLEREWGRIITVSSGGGVRVLPQRAAYATSKAGLIALTKVAALEGAARGVTANVVAPGLTDTGMAAAVYGDRTGAAHAVGNSLAANPMGVLLEPSDIAEAIAFLASPESRYITGQVLHVNGGGVM
jgi:NAD(P)-dependent dehydrogenase (short-subunit alcohol dehydrogenase family)